MFGFFPFAAAPFADLGSQSVSVDVTGVSATGQVGSVTVAAGADVTLTGVSATGFVGAVDVNGTANVDLTGVRYRPSWFSNSPSRRRCQRNRRRSYRCSRYS